MFIHELQKNTPMSSGGGVIVVAVRVGGGCCIDEVKRAGFEIGAGIGIGNGGPTSDRRQYIVLTQTLRNPESLGSKALVRR